MKKKIKQSTRKYLSIGTPKIIHFPLNGKLMVLGVPIFKYRDT